MNQEQKAYKVKLECLVPATIEFKTIAHNEDEALDNIIHNRSLTVINAQYYLPRRKNIRASVYEFGQLIVKLVKSFI